MLAWVPAAPGKMLQTNSPHSFFFNSSINLMI